MLVNSNTVEYNVSQEKKKLYETIHGGTLGMKSQLIGFSKNKPRIM